MSPPACPNGDRGSRPDENGPINPVDTTTGNALLAPGAIYRARARCPWCDSTDTRLASLFGGTVSEVLFECLACRTPFGVMKWDTLPSGGAPGLAPAVNKKV